MYPLAIGQHIGQAHTPVPPWFPDVPDSLRMREKTERLLEQRRAGHSVEVLLRVYAKCVSGQEEIANHRIEEILGHDDSGSRLAA